MRRLIVISGISGAGKSYLLEQLAGRSSELVPIRKMSTRAARDYELSAEMPIDLEYGVSKSRISDCDYRYNYSGNIYGFKKKDLDRVLESGRCPIVIVRSVHTIEHLKREYPDCIVIYIKSAYTGKDLKKILREQGRTDIEIEERMHRHRDDLVDYTRNIKIFDYVFSNLYDDDSLITQFDEILLVEESKSIIDYGFIFVLMSFNPELDGIYSEIEDAAKLVNPELRVLRIDKKMGDYPITKEILENIEKAELIVCDLSEEKPNVYYELGYARGREKTVIHCARQGTKLHFDVKDFHTVFYKNSSDFRRKLIAEFREQFNRS